MKKLSEKQKLIIMIASAAMVLAVVTCILLLRLGTPIPRTSDGEATSEPYKMVVDGKEILLVKNRAEGIAALSDVVKDYTPKGMTTTRVDFDKRITFEKKEIKPFRKLTTVLNEEEAADQIRSLNEKKTPLFTATVTAEKSTNELVQPVVKFKYDEKLDLFDYKVEKSGIEGLKRVKYEYVTENGEVVSKGDKESIVLFDPHNAVVRTGYDEAPKKLKWKDYGKYQKAVEDEYGDAIVGGEMVDYGKKFLGNPYKWGGKSLTHGIDCVQFVRALYRKYGINLPGKRSAFAHIGRGVSLKNARPGDIVYYGNHVAMYIGNGKIIHAQRKGISISNINYRKWKTIRRVKKK